MRVAKSTRLLPDGDWWRRPHQCQPPPPLPPLNGPPQLAQRHLLLRLFLIALMLMAAPGPTSAESVSQCSVETGENGSCEADFNTEQQAASEPDSQWHPLGGFVSTGDTQFTNIAVSAGNVSYVGFRDLDTPGSKATVCRFEAGAGGGSWRPVGSPGFSGGATALYVSMALHPASGLPWLAYTDGGPAHGGGSARARVMWYDGHGWLDAGGGDVSPEASDVGKLTFASKWGAGGGTEAAPHLAVVERGGPHAGRVSVFFLAPGAEEWSAQGARGMSPPGSHSPSIGHWPWNSGGRAGTTVRVAYADGGQAGKLSCRISLCPSCAWTLCPGTTDGFSDSAVADVDIACAISVAGHETPCYLMYLDDTDALKVWSSSLAGPSDPADSVTVVWDGSADRQEHAAAYDGATQHGGGEGGSAAEGGIPPSSKQGTWSRVGLPRLPQGSASYISIALDPQNTLLVAYRDGSAGGRAVVMRHLPAEDAGG